MLINLKELNGLLLRGNDHFLSFALPWYGTLLTMFPHILFPSLNGRKFFLFDLTCFLNSLRQMTVTSDSSNLGHMGVPPDQRLIVF